jgi:hypothetical protein
MADDTKYTAYGNRQRRPPGRFVDLREALRASADFSEADVDSPNKFSTQPE